MGRPSKQILDFMEAFKVDADEVWEVRTGGAWAIKHAALERVAAEAGIVFELSKVIEADGERKLVAMCVTGRMGDRSEWSIGEAAPGNNKNAYPYAMAEKRAKDRVILKLLNSHGTLYSEAEADEFERRQNPHVTRPTDLVPDVEYDENGLPVDNIPNGDDRIERLPKAKARTEYAALQSELYKISDLMQLASWAEANKNRVETLPSDWQSTLRGQYAEHRDALRQKTKEVA